MHGRKMSLDRNIPVMVRKISKGLEISVPCTDIYRGTISKCSWKSSMVSSVVRNFSWCMYLVWWSTSNVFLYICEKSFLFNVIIINSDNLQYSIHKLQCRLGTKTYICVWWDMVEIYCLMFYVRHFPAIDRILFEADNCKIFKQYP